MSEVQVDKKHYEFNRYGFEGRFVSYYWQLKEVLEFEPESILEVGVGDKVFGNFIKENTAVAYTSVDIASDLAPDVVGSVLELPFPDNTFDVVCAFEVLEHLPFSDVERAVSELTRVAKVAVLVSVPHFGPMLQLSFKIPFIPTVQVAVKIPFPKKHVFNGQHYWELGKAGYPPSLLRGLLQKHGKVVKDFVPFNSAYHHFFVVYVGA
jgi:SAM-dependent methyltransferase